MGQLYEYAVGRDVSSFEWDEMTKWKKEINGDRDGEHVVE